MKSYNVAGKFTLTIFGGKIKAVSGGTEQTLNREQAAKILRKARKEKNLTPSNV